MRHWKTKMATLKFKQKNIFKEKGTHSKEEQESFSNIQETTLKKFFFKNRQTIML